MDVLGDEAEPGSGSYSARSEARRVHGALCSCRFSSPSAEPFAMWDFMNHVPVLGHIKAGIHAAANDTENFERTLHAANEATNHTPVLGHVKAAVHHAAGDHEKGWDAVEKANTVTDHVPILGHVKAGVHQAAGHHDRAHYALEKANASTDYVPVLGHVKGVVHLIAGEHQKALTSFRLSSTTAALAALIIELPPELVLVSMAAGMLSMASMASASEHQKWLMQIQKKEVETLFAMRENGELSPAEYEAAKEDLLKLVVIEKANMA